MKNSNGLLGRLLSRRSIVLAALSLNILALGACSSLQHQKDDASVGHVKRAAVVAFSAYEPTSATIGLNGNNGKVEGGAGGSMIPTGDPTVDKMYEDLSHYFGQNLKWNMVPDKTMRANAGYKTAFDKTMKGWQNKMPPGAGTQQFLVKEVMDFDSPRILDVAGRDALIDALGVDAIIVARIDVQLRGTTVMGIGSRHPQSTLSFWVYKKGDAKPIWFEGAVRGEESAESVGKTAFIDEKLLGQLALKSADTAYTKIGATATE